MATIAETDARGTYLADFERFDKELPAAEPAPIKELRRRAIRSFGEQGFPSVRQEEWRFTDVTRIARADLERVRPEGAVLDTEALRPFAFAGADRLVFVNGFFTPRLSTVAELPPGVVVGGLGEALERTPEKVEPHLGHHARFDEQPFVALNTAFLRDGAFLYLPRGTVLERPIHLLFVATDAGTGRASVAYPRNLVVAEEGSQAILLESYETVGHGAHLTCPVTEVVAGPGAVLDHYRLQRESTEAFHVGTFQIHQDRSSNVRSHTISIGGALVRNDVNVVLDGEGCDCTLNGLYVVEGEQHVDNHMRVEHVAPHCHSYELFKGVLDGRARAVFNGLIHVHPGAQKTDAKQSNRNLLLSKGAVANSNPQLEIYADDVKCTHGSTVGQLDDEAVFYLRSRGIAESAARSLLTYAFASDIVGRIKVEPVRRELEEFLFTRLPEGEVVRQAV